ncbi:MAG TPA: M48 family metallopeptidase [Steroidobacteraceae bacterium]|nr:M48 family metallopeptidase [Steroidobacteraceae bacterium]
MVSATYFDGRSTRVHDVELSVVGQDLVVAGTGIDLRVPIAQVRIDERLGRAARRLRLPDGTCCEVRDLEALDGLLSSTAHRDGWVDRMQRHWRSVLLALVAFGVVAVGMYKWGLPWAAAVGARRLPPVFASIISTQALKTLDGGLLRKSRIAIARQRSLVAKFDGLQIPENGTPHSLLLFRASPQLGANAFTLPDGTIVLLDDLTTSIGDDSHILAVLAHELGHAHEHHGLQLLLRSSAVGAFLTFYLGDISQLLAAAPAALIQARYSQEFEQQADDYAAALLNKHGLSPGLLADDLSRLSKLRPDASGGGYLESHPPTDRRIRHLRELARTDAFRRHS